MTQSLSGSGWHVASSNGTVRAAATVPGSAYTDLMRSGVIDDPYFRFNEQLTRWVALTDWVYSTAFTVHPALLALPRIELVLDGVDTVGDVLLDGRQVLRVDNMFRRWVVDVTEALKGSTAEHNLTVVLRSAVQFAAELNATYPYPLPRSDPPSVHPMGERQFVRKSQVDFGWNNQPGLTNIGIYRPVGLLAYHTAVIRDLVVTQLHGAALTEGERARIGLGSADVRLNVTAYLRVAPGNQAVATAAIVTACVAGQCANSAALHLIASPLQSGEALQPISVILVLRSPELWWPYSLGNATLYPLTITLLSDPSVVEHSLTRHIGFRYMTILRTADSSPGLTFHFSINGVPFFVKGSNVVPLDSFHSRVTPSNLTRLLLSARASNLHVLRVWGGGLVQPDEFYAAADALGLMVWQEAPFACATYPVWEWWLRGVREETAQIVRRVAWHPSVVVWGGNNENEVGLTWYPDTVQHRDRYLLDYDALYTRTVRDAFVREVGHGTEFLLSSPSNGPLSEDPFTQRWGDANDPTYGDVHFYLYGSDLSDPTVFIDARFVSEHGFPSHSSYRATAAMSLPSDRSPRSALMLYRNRLAPSAGLPDGLAVLQAQLDRHFLTPNVSDPEERFHAFLYTVQCVQALHYQGALEKYRRSQSGGPESALRTQGILFWMLNEAWPGAPSKATIEWDGRWKVTQYAVKRAFAEVIVSGYSVPSRDHVGVAVVNDLRHGWAGSVEVQVRRWSDGSVVRTVTEKVTVTAQAAVYVLQSTASALLAGERNTSSFLFLSASLSALDTAPSNLSVESWVYLTPLKLVALSPPNITVAVLDDVDASPASPSPRAALEVRAVVSCTAPAPYVFLETPLSGVWSDNGFLLLPDRPRALTFTSWEGDITAAQLRLNLTVLTTQLTIPSGDATSDDDIDT